MSTGNVTADTNTLVSLLNQLATEPNQVAVMADFFSEAFVSLTDHDLFNDTDYRKQWSLLLYQLRQLANCTEPQEQFTLELNKAIKQAASI